MGYKVTLERSQACAETYGGMEGDTLVREYPDADYIEFTYEYLRVGPNGEFSDIVFSEGVWYAATDSLPYSDIVIEHTEGR